MIDPPAPGDSYRCGLDYWPLVTREVEVYPEVSILSLIVESARNWTNTRRHTRSPRIDNPAIKTGGGGGLRERERDRQIDRQRQRQREKGEGG